MNTGEIVTFTFVLIVSLLAFVFSVFQFRGKGFLLNNAYLYASKSERKEMDKKPYYKQSAIVFLFIGVIFLLNAVEIMVKSGLLSYLSIALAVIAIIYAIASSIYITAKIKK